MKKVFHFGTMSGLVVTNPILSGLATASLSGGRSGEVRSQTKNSLFMHGMPNLFKTGLHLSTGATRRMAHENVGKTKREGERERENKREREINAEEENERERVKEREILR